MGRVSDKADVCGGGSFYQVPVHKSKMWSPLTKLTIKKTCLLKQQQQQQQQYFETFVNGSIGIGCKCELE